MTSPEEIKAEIREQNAPRFIDVTPTWEQLMPAFFAILENGTDTGKDLARAELTRLARMADAIHAQQKAEQQRRETLAPYADDPTDHD
jgi:hypothetical protein